MGLSDKDLGARVRAARGYAGLSQQALGDATGLERKIVVAIEGNDPRHPLAVEEAQRIAAVCNVPASFLLSGWAAPRSLVARVAALEAAVERGRADRDLQAAEVEALSDRLEKRFADLAGQAPQKDSAQDRADNRRRRADQPVPGGDPESP
jgi:transcriptional regulator with XRE-family HTH domain